MLGRILTLVLLVALASCKTTDEPDAIVLDFDTSADEDVMRISEPYRFCADSSNFNIVNSYWLGVASAYVYANRASLTRVVDQMKASWDADVTFFSNDEESALKHHTQAMWVDLPNVTILAFRGTQVSIQDWVTDFRVLAKKFDPGRPLLGNVHLGFNDALDVIWPQIEAKLLSLRGSNKPLYVTGHSLGGALAVVASGRILMQPNLAEVARNNIRGLYTYGAPRAGDEAFARAFKERANKIPAFHVVRTRNFADIVTRVPSTRLFVGYEHIGPLYYFDQPGRLYSTTTNVNFRRLFMPRDMAEKMIENLLSYRLRSFVTKYTDHKMGGYLDKLRFEYTRSLEYSRRNALDECDMSMFSVPWAVDPRPEPKENTSELPIAAARVEEQQTVKDCCWCYRTWYNSTWGYDQAFKQENFVGVRQEGELAAGSCMYPGGKPQGHLFWQGTSTAENGRTYDQYYTYSDCGGITLVGDACKTGVEIFKDRRGTGRAIKSSSWVP